MTTAIKTLSQLAADAIAVQDACNLSGVIHSFAKAITDLRTHIYGTDAVNNHPICRLWADKIASLTGTQTLGNDQVMAAYSAVYALIGA